MKMLNHAFFACLLDVGLVSCSHARQQKTKEFRLPDMSVTPAAPEDRTVYLPLYYWDHFDSAGTSFISRPEIAEQAFVDFLGILPYIDRAQATINTLFRRAAVEQEMLYHFTELNDEYLCEPDLPMHDEELYILVLRALLDSPYLSDMGKVRPCYLLEIAMKNRPGDAAVDFIVIYRDGRRRQLSGIEADYVLIYFNDPDYESCRRAKELLTLSPVVNDLLGSDRLRLLSVCAEGKAPVWGKAEFPAGWINSYNTDQRLTREQVYDLKTMPILYLLNTGERVVPKNTSSEQVGERLS